jgi:integrase
MLDFTVREQSRGENRLTDGRVNGRVRRSPNTASRTSPANTQSRIAHHIEPHLGRLRLSKLTPQELQRWLSTMAEKGVSVGRRRYARVVLRNALNTAVRWRLISQNPATLVDAPRTVHREIRPLTADEAKLFLAAAKTHPLEAFFVVALACGLRLGEALGIQWNDVDLDAGNIQVHRAVQRAGGDVTARRPLLANRKRLLKALRDLEMQEPSRPDADEEHARLSKELQGIRKALATVKTSVQISEPKSARSRRTIALPTVAVTALRTHRVRQLEV